MTDPEQGGNRRGAIAGLAIAVAILAIGLLWPHLSQIGLGRLPGDLVIERRNVTIYFPLMTCLLLSVLFSLVLWVVNR